MKFSERAADKLAGVMGSWKFVLSQAAFLTAWFAWNGLHMTGAWDLYPFILANLVMSAQAAFATPILLMSGNRAAANDRRTLLEDVKLDAETLERIKRIEEKINEVCKPS
jgi:uncharacterized membrane protein